jgi:hypothetical protein
MPCLNIKENINLINTVLITFKMKLSNQEIRFIDQYLQKADVIFVDVRSELTDHIASAVEEKMELEELPFYDAFKAYMVVNKKMLLASRRMNFTNYKNGMIRFSKTLIKPQNIIFAIMLLFGFHYLNQLISLEMMSQVLFFMIFLFVFVQAIYTFFIIKKRYLYLENSSSVLLVIYYVNLFSNGFGLYAKNFIGNQFSIGITLFLLFAYVGYCITTIRKFRFKYS